MLLRLPTTMAEAQDCLAEGAVPVGGATLVWADWQQDGFPEQAVSLRNLPQANVLGPDAVGGAVVLHRIDGRVPDVLRLAAQAVGTGAVRRTATVGGNIVGSALRCLLPAALVLGARALVLAPEGPYQTDLGTLVAKRLTLVSLRWPTPAASSYRKVATAPGGPPPFVVALALHASAAAPTSAAAAPFSSAAAPTRLRIAVREGYQVHSESTSCDGGADQVLDALARTPIGALPLPALATVREQVTDLLVRTV